jgi:hypothetical protein
MDEPLESATGPGKAAQGKPGAFSREDRIEYYWELFQNNLINLCSLVKWRNGHL